MDWIQVLQDAVKWQAIVKAWLFFDQRLKKNCALWS
jgi:hypothetical protein